MTTQETLAQIEHLLVENERSLRNELSGQFLRHIYYDICDELVTDGLDKPGEPVTFTTEKGKMLLQFRSWFKEKYKIKIDE